MTLLSHRIYRDKQNACPDNKIYLVYLEGYSKNSPQYRMKLEKVWGTYKMRVFKASIYPIIWFRILDFDQVPFKENRCFLQNNVAQGLELSLKSSDSY